MGSRSVWGPALQDIVEVIPLRIVRYVIPTMSPRDIKRTAIRTARMDSLFHNKTIRPAEIQCIDLHSDVVALGIGHGDGGKWILLMHGDGSIHLHRIQQYGGASIHCLSSTI